MPEKLLFIWFALFLGLFPFHEAKAECEELAASAKKFLKIQNTASYYKVQRLEAFLKEAEKCKEGIKNIHYRFIRHAAHKEARLCTEEMRWRIARETRDRDVKRDIEDFRHCALVAGNDPKEVESEATRLQRANEEELKKRRADCAEVAVDTSAMGPPRNQGNIGWCYAHAAADLVSHRVGKRISAIELAMNYNDGFFFRRRKSKGASELSEEGGFVDSAASISIKKGFGFCAEEDFRGDLGGTKSVIEHYRSIEKLKEAVDGSEAVSDYALCEKGYGWAKEIMKDLSAKEFLEILSHTPREELFAAFRKVSCRERIKLDADNVSVENMYGSNAAFRQMDKLLDKETPVGVSYHISLLGLADPGGHANVVVGRRFDEKSGECQYRVRNTWSTKWNKDGHFWIPKRKLRKDLKAITYLN